MKEKLPCTFRVNPLNTALIEKLKDPDFVKNWREGDASLLSEEEMAKVQLKHWDFYPGDLVYELPLERSILRKDPSLKRLHKYIQKCADSGLITRQEIVSMIPPLLLEVRPHHAVLDTCAAPGSKTA